VRVSHAVLNQLRRNIPIRVIGVARANKKRKIIGGLDDMLSCLEQQASPFALK
jgi:hypothetical protein